MLSVDENTFEEAVLNSTIPVILDFWAPWCFSCKPVMAMLEKLQPEYEGRVKVCKVNVDLAPALAEKFRIKSLPTLLSFREGGAEGFQQGFKDEAMIRAIFEDLILP